MTDSTPRNSPDMNHAISEHAAALREWVRSGVSPGVTTIGQLAGLLGAPSWLVDDSVTVIIAIGGKIPVHWSPQDTAFVITVPDGGAMYFAVEGKFTVEELTLALQGRSHVERVLSTVISGVGFSPDVG